MRRTLLLVTLLGGCASARPPSAPLALGPTHLWVAPMRVYSGGGVWFPAELEVVEDAVAAFLEAHEGFEVVSLPALRRLRKNVRAGFLPGRRDACPRPPRLPPSSPA